MQTNYKVFGYNGEALIVLRSELADVPAFFKKNPEVKRVEVYEREDNQSLWDEKLVKTHHAKEFKK